MAWSIDRADATELTSLVLKGFPYPIAAVEIHRWREHAERGPIRSGAGRVA